MKRYESILSKPCPTPPGWCPIFIVAMMWLTMLPSHTISSCACPLFSNSAPHPTALLNCWWICQKPLLFGLYWWLMISAIVSPLSQTLLPLPDDIISLSFQSQHVKVIPNAPAGKNQKSYHCRLKKVLWLRQPTHVNSYIYNAVQHISIAACGYKNAICWVSLSQWQQEIVLFLHL